MFHVEPCDGNSHCGQRWWRLGPGDQHLCSAIAQALEHSALVFPIKLGGKVVQTQHRPMAVVLRKVRRLRQKQPQCRKLGLTARQALATRKIFKVQTQVRAVGAYGGVAE